MIRTIFEMPDTTRHALSCVWIDTGNPTQPLACVWIDEDLCAVPSESEGEPEIYPLCA
jgi:hypothetical protein